MFTQLNFLYLRIFYFRVNTGKVMILTKKSSIISATSSI